jgi:hypothetical protein
MTINTRRLSKAAHQAFRRILTCGSGYMYAHLFVCFSGWAFSTKCTTWTETAARNYKSRPRITAQRASHRTMLPNPRTPRPHSWDAMLVADWRTRRNAMTVSMDPGRIPCSLLPATDERPNFSRHDFRVWEQSRYRTCTVDHLHPAIYQSLCNVRSMKTRDRIVW